MLADQVINLLPDLEDPKQCLSRAHRCELMAKRRPDQEQEMFLELAARWRLMAREIETEFSAHK